MKTDVQFRKFRGTVIAVLPYEISESTNVTCYSHIGQHSSCSYNINRYSKPAKKEDYKPLLLELKSIGYDLNIIKRRSHVKYLKALMKAYSK